MRDKYLDFTRVLKVTVMPIVIGFLRTMLKGFVRELEELKIGGRANPPPRNYSIVEVSQNTEKSPRDLRRFAHTRPPVEDAGVKNLQEAINKSA